jgi:hypothetical protein
MAEYYRKQPQVEYTVVVEMTTGTEGISGEHHGRQAYIVPSTWTSADQTYVLLPKRIRNPFATEKQRLNVLTPEYFAIRDKYSDEEMHERFQTIPFPLADGFEEHKLKG